MGLLDQIKEPNDIKKLPESDLPDLALEIRRFILKITARNGGHVASNLGAVELTIALHRFLTFPEDVLIWDVGHQAYTHKLLTGRGEELLRLRKTGGASGFPKRKESSCDAFGTGHSSTSISAALGFAKARELLGGTQKIVAVIGDGALTGGMALEALNNASELESNLTIVLNDNERSISENVGGMANYLGKIRTNTNYQEFKDDVETVVRGIPAIGNAIARRIKISKDSLKRFFVPGMLFEDMGLTYIGPIDGHDIRQMEMALASTSRVKGTALIHVITKKGKGYRSAEQHPAQFHGMNPFLVKTGEDRYPERAVSYTDLFSKTMLELAEENPRLVAVTAAMPYGTGLYDFKKSYPKRFFDVGIAEQHAVTFAAGLAAAGMKPVVAIYSTFLQRAYDQILHDVCLQGLPVVFAVDRAGLVGSDGETHQGIYDISYLSSIPGMTIMSPKDGIELAAMLRYALELDRPVAIRYPRGKAELGDIHTFSPIVWGENEILQEGEEVLILATGAMVTVAREAAALLQEHGIRPTLVNVRFLQEADEALLERMAANHRILVMLEEGICSGSYSQKLSAALAKRTLGYRFLPCTLPDSYVEHGSIAELRQRYHLDAEAIKERIINERTAGCPAG